MRNSKYRNISVAGWRDLRTVLDEHRGWAFRGQRQADWSLYSTLSRYFIAFGVHRDAWPVQEKRILRIFKRKAHLLLTHIPEEDDPLEWLALMQHHGAPTRLLDFTWSPYVAAFFALERAAGNAAIWAIFPPGLKRPMGPYLTAHYEEDFLPNTKRIIAIGEPLRMNQRLVAQAGTFVLPGVLHEPVESLAPGEAIVKIILEAGKMRREAMEELYNMNITNATLFPGLDGLARSLAYELEYHWEFDPVTMKRKKGF
jgi:hypothetical protein